MCNHLQYTVNEGKGRIPVKYLLDVVDLFHHIHLAVQFLRLPVKCRNVTLSST